MTRLRLFRVLRRLADHDDMLRDHHAELGDHDERLAALEQWANNPDQLRVAIRRREREEGKGRP